MTTDQSLTPHAVHSLLSRVGMAPQPDGRRRFEALGGYPTRSQAEAAPVDALARRSHGFVLDPAKLPVDQYLDHIRLSLRARTVARYTALLRDHVRPHADARPLKPLTRWRSRPSMTGWPSAGAGTASRAGWPLSTSWPCTAACTAP